MHATEAAKVRILFQAPAPGSPEERFERRAREIVGEMRGRDGRPINPNVRRANKATLVRAMITNLAKARRKGVPRDQALKLKAAFEEYLDERWPEPAARTTTTHARQRTA